MASRKTRKHLDPQSPTFRRCESQKIGYRTYDEALMAAERMMMLDRVEPGCHITPYRCDRCHEWHLHNRRIVAMPGDQSARHRAARGA